MRLGYSEIDIDQQVSRLLGMIIGFEQAAAKYPTNRKRERRRREMGGRRILGGVFFILVFA